eukprot:5963536-Pleurochrysis_carterae.AAC.1
MEELDAGFCYRDRHAQAAHERRRRAVCVGRLPNATQNTSLALPRHVGGQAEERNVGRALQGRCVSRQRVRCHSGAVRALAERAMKMAAQARDGRRNTATRSARRTCTAAKESGGSSASCASCGDQERKALRSLKCPIHASCLTHAGDCPQMKPTLSQPHRCGRAPLGSCTRAKDRAAAPEQKRPYPGPCPASGEGSERELRALLRERRVRSPSRRRA